MNTYRPFAFVGVVLLLIITPDMGYGPRHPLCPPVWRAALGTDTGVAVSVFAAAFTLVTLAGAT